MISGMLNLGQSSVPARIRLIRKKNLSDAELESWTSFLCDARRSPAFSQCSLTSWEVLSARACQQYFGKKPFFLYFDKDNEILAQAIVSFTHFSRWIRSIVDVHGLTIKECDDEAFWVLAQSLLSFGRESKAFALRLSRANLLESDAENLRDALINSGLDVREEARTWKYTNLIDLLQSEEEILDSFNSTTRYKVRRATRDGTTVKSGRGREDLAVFYDLFQEMWERKGQRCRYSLPFFERIANRLMVFNAFSEEDIPLVSAVIVHDGLTARYTWGASAPRPGRAAPLVHYEAMLWAKRQGLRFYDMGGIPVEPDDPQLKGIKFFKEGFRGLTVRQLDSLVVVLRPFLYERFRHARGYFHQLVE